MERLRYILRLLAVFVLVSCTEVPVFQESQVPEIVSITSIPETHSAVLMSDLDTAPFGRIECGFYLGTDKTNLKRMETALSGKSFTLLLEGLKDGTTYYFKAFISNGINEIATGFESFVTETEPDPIKPVEPEQPEQPEPENPEPEQPSEPEPDDPSEPEPEQPSDPEEPGEDDTEEPDEGEPSEPEEPVTPDEPVEFTTEIASVSVSINNDIAELTAELSGDTNLVKECWFMVGYTPDKLSKINGSITDTAVKAYLAGLEPGNYYYKAVITDGIETKESELLSFSF